MFGDTTKTVHVPLSEYTNRELRARAAELRQMATTASSTAGMQALEALGMHFDALAERREAEDYEAYRAAVALALRLTGAERLGAQEPLAKPGPDPMGLPSPHALQIATDAICRHNAVSETREHPATQAASLDLAYLLMAYGLVPAEPELGTAQPAMAGEPRREGSLDRPRLTGHHVLVVDDVADVLVTVGAFLVNAGFEVEKAANGDEALRLIASNPQIDVLVTDFAMPGLTGVELIAQAVQIRPNLKSLLITGYPNADGLAELPPHTTILVKPFRRYTLLAEVRSLLGAMSPVREEAMEMVDQKRD